MIVEFDHEQQTIFPIFDISSFLIVPVARILAEEPEKLQMHIRRLKRGYHEHMFYGTLKVCVSLTI